MEMLLVLNDRTTHVHHIKYILAVNHGNILMRC